MSEMLANRVALAVSPATPAFNEDEIVIDTPFCSAGLDLVTGNTAPRLNVRLTDKMRSNSSLPSLTRSGRIAQQDDLQPVIAQSHRIARHQLTVGMAGYAIDPLRLDPEIFQNQAHLRCALLR